MKNSKISLIEIKRYLKKKGLDIIKKLERKNLDSVFKFFSSNNFFLLSCFLIICFNLV